MENNDRRTLYAEITVLPEEMAQTDVIRAKALKKAAIGETKGLSIRVVRRSLDARSRMPKFILKVAIGDEEGGKRGVNPFRPRSLGERRVVIVGAGPAGYFAALKFLEYGIRPVILERGKDVNERRKDIKKLYREGLVNAHSNYCFGEGGAGAYSDGKLYTRSTKRGDVGRILNLFAAHGASEDILIDAHPHIGSNVLPKVVRNLRESIVGAGGEIIFDAFVDDLVVAGGKISGVRVNRDEIFSADSRCPGDGTFGPGHLPHVGCQRHRHGGKTLCHGSPDRTSAGNHRPDFFIIIHPVIRPCRRQHTGFHARWRAGACFLSACVREDMSSLLHHRSGGAGPKRHEHGQKGWCLCQRRTGGGNPS